MSSLSARSPTTSSPGGRPPIARSTCPAALREGSGLRLSGAVNGVGTWLEEMVRVATAPVVRDRPRDAREFLDYLAEAEKEALPPEPAPPPLADPATAGPGDRLDGGFTVVNRLGRGGSADALLVRRDDSEEELVLKVAIDAAHADRVRAEAEVLRRLHHQNIVRFVAEATVSERPAILMERAGDKTLAQWIRGGDTLSLDLMRRFGENLLSALEHLEQEGVAHRDIKPDNIGIAKVAGTGAYRLVLFDFSLSRAPAENIQAGTRPYLDPFLADRRPPRWDLHAERYAAAITLHEMLAGAPPVFGDGLTDPSVTDDEATIALERFDPDACATGWPPSSPAPCGATLPSASATRRKCCARGATPSRPWTADTSERGQYRGHRPPPASRQQHRRAGLRGRGARRARPNGASTPSTSCSACLA